MFSCDFGELTLFFFVSDSVFLRVDPNRLQFFEYDGVTFHCEGVKGEVLSCRTNSRPASKQVSCNIKNVFPEDSGEYWCEAEGGERSNSVDIIVTGMFDLRQQDFVKFI